MLVTSVYSPLQTSTWFSPGSFNTVRNENFLDLSKFKEFADDKRNVKEQLKFGRVKNIVGKRENASYHICNLFPQCFQKATFSKSLKSELCGRVKHRVIWYSFLTTCTEYSILHIKLNSTCDTHKKKERLKKMKSWGGGEGVRLHG